MLVHVDIFRRTLNIKKLKSLSLNDSELMEEMKVKLKKEMKTDIYVRTWNSIVRLWERWTVDSVIT